MNVYKKDDDKWYVLLEAKNETSLGEKGPFNTKSEAVQIWFNYCDWLSAMDAN